MENFSSQSTLAGLYDSRTREGEASPWHRPVAAPPPQSAVSNSTSNPVSFSHESLSIPRHISSPSEVPNVESVGVTRPPPGFEDRAAKYYNIKITNLPRAVSERELNAMLLFAGDLAGIHIKPPSPGGVEGDYNTTAVAQFGSEKSAKEAQERLDGKPFSPEDRKMSVQLLGSSHESLIQSASNSPSNSDVLVSGTDFSQYTTNATRNRGSPPNGQLYGSTNGAGGIGGVNGVNGANGINGASALNGIATTNGMVPTGESSFDPRPFDLREPPSFFNPLGFQQPPQPGRQQQAQQSQRLFMPDEYDGDDTGTSTRARALTSPVVAGGARGLGGLPPLITANSTVNGFQNMPPTSALVSPITVASPANFGWTGRHLPPANPADQNPPCNTLYVGNLPANTTEDELKNLFCRQRGYKRLCFRAKQNGPMCFVEFEDIGMATKALTELYGRNLSTSVKGGIRLSFSKNPLGVRSHPVNGLSTPVTPTNSGSQFSSPASPFTFSTASHNPPGLPAPPNRQMATHHQSNHDQPNGTAYSHHQMGYDQSNGTTYSHQQIGHDQPNGNGYPHHQIGHERSNGVTHPLHSNSRDEPNGVVGHSHQFGVSGIPPHLIGK
ncbi:hypothetical protein HOY80DRAFT_897491 [Tuber brumale]|nr:hypothetical protein HOY80DRAFT_897491 [Tuber brumale]